MHSQHNADAFLDRAEDIAPLMPKVRRLLELRRAVMRLLPPGMSRSCTVANDRQGRLVLFAENNVIAAKLKLLAPALRDRLSESGQQVTAVTVAVQPPRPRERALLRKGELSVDAATALTDLSARIADPQLKAALLTLASRAAKR